MVVGTLDEVRTAFPGLAVPAHIAAHGFWLKRTVWHGQPLVIVAGSNPHGALFGAFDLLRRIATDADLSHLDAIEAPAMPIRWVDEWDNADGTITRGYDGRSIFFEGGKVRDDLSEATAYARLLASVGINGCNVNNVNGAAPFLAAGHDQRPGADRRRHAPLGRAPRHQRRHRQPAKNRRPQNLRSCSIPL